MKFSLFPHIHETQNSVPITIADFLNGIRLGKWQEIANTIKAEKDKGKRQELKKKVPYATVSGIFEKRLNAGLLEHSGLIAMDFDNLAKADVDGFYEKLCADPYTYAAFRSISGLGICVIAVIDGNRHLDSFLALESYYMATYGLLVDTQCKDVSRARFISYDPNLFCNPKSKLFKNYLPKKALKEIPKVIYGNSDIDFVFKQIEERRVDLTNSSYDRYLKLAFALHSEFGEGGREYFHRVAMHSGKYDSVKADKQFDYCVRSMRTGIGMATFFYYAKEAGLQIHTERTTLAATVAKQTKKAGRDQESAKKSLAMEGIKGEDADKIIEQVYNSNIDLKTGDSLSILGQLELFLQTNYRLKRNEITRYIENAGQPLETPEMNSIYIKAKKVVDDKVNFMDLEKLINSEFTEDYNPILDFFDTFRSRNETGLIKRLASTIETDTGKQALGAVDNEYFEHFLTKWMIGMIASVHGHHSPLLLALTGGQNSGKTEWFRRLLPEQLQRYYAESKLDAGKDDEILMCQKLLIMDDELGGKSKKDEKRLKELTSKKTFTLREPYGKKNVDLKRLAVLAGTTNETAVLNDPTGNRRIIPINVLNINHAVYNAIDKVSLIMEAFHLYQGGVDWNLDRQDIDRLNGHTKEFEQVRPEFELITQYFGLPGSNGGIGKAYVTATQIKAEIEKLSNQRLSASKIGIELKAAGFIQQMKTIDGHTHRLYAVVRLNRDAFVPEAQAEPIAKPPVPVIETPKPSGKQLAIDESNDEPF